jgi:DNA-binding MarR family transcriptional regulator
MSSPAAARKAPESALVLAQFLPYRLSVLSNRVSRAIARAYERAFALTIPEWRVIAVLGRDGALTAADLVEATQMDKVAISRAVARLVRAGRLKAAPDRADARKLVLRLTARGASVYDAVAPMALAYEARLMAALTAEERRVLDRALAKLAAAARDLDRE